MNGLITELNIRRNRSSILKRPIHPSKINENRKSVSTPIFIVKIEKARVNKS